MVGNPKDWFSDVMDFFKVLISACHINTKTFTMLNYLSCVKKNLLFAYAKTKAQISCVVTTLLISTFVFGFWLHRKHNSFLKSKISSLEPSTVVLHPDLCRTWSETLQTSFVMTPLIYSSSEIRTSTCSSLPDILKAFYHSY